MPKALTTDDINRRIKEIFPESKTVCVKYVVGRSALSLFCIDGREHKAQWWGVKSALLKGNDLLEGGWGYDNNKPEGTNYCYMICLQIYNFLFLCSKLGKTQVAYPWGTRMPKPWHETYAPIVYTSDCRTQADITGASIASSIETMVHNAAEDVRLPVVEAIDTNIEDFGPSEIFIGNPFGFEVPDFTQIISVVPDNRDELLEAINNMPPDAVAESLELAKLAGCTKTPLLAMCA